MSSTDTTVVYHVACETAKLLWHVCDDEGNVPPWLRSVVANHMTECGIAARGSFAFVSVARFINQRKRYNATVQFLPGVSYVSAKKHARARAREFVDYSIQHFIELGAKGARRQYWSLPLAEQMVYLTRCSAAGSFLLWDPVEGPGAAVPMQHGVGRLVRMAPGARTLPPSHPGRKSVG